MMGFGGTHRPGLDEALADRLSFRRFVGLALADPVPDDSILSRFRSELTAARGRATGGELNPTA
jgi:IS5 family transposase